MYGVPANLDLSRFHGATLIQISLGEHEIQLVFQDADAGRHHHIGIYGRWELRDAAGELVDTSMANDVREAYRIHTVLGRQVSGSALDAPRSFLLRFENGSELSVFDDSEQYESFSIQPGDIFV